MIDISALREREFNSALTVSELNNYIKNLFDTNRTLMAVSVTGEISNFTDHRSGHLYFSLKDSDAQIKAVMFKSQRMRLKFTPESGMKVTVHGSVSVYSQTGSVQIYINSMEPDGVGALYVAYEQLKARLGEEGLFDEDKKKELPRFPERIGVITSPTGAAVRDIINVTGRRYPLAKIYLYPSLVQGDGAEDNLIRALDFFDKSKLVDLVIIGRGGGSIEDLWAFNSEKLARRIYEAVVPIISAVGHETDFTICDFVSDMRAPTPSAAAEIAVPDIREISMRIDDYEERLESALLRTVERKRERLDKILENEIFTNPETVFHGYKQRISELYECSVKKINDALSDVKNELRILVERTNALSPLSVLERGYSVVEGEKGILKHVTDITTGENIKITLSDGSLSASVTEVRNGK